MEGRHLDQFTKWILDKASSEVLIVNPYVKECDLSQQLIESKQRGLGVILLTQRPKYQDQRCHIKLKDNGVEVNYDPDVHAKLVIVDMQVAIVSSMNFYSESSAGKTWEAGMVSVDNRVIQTIKKSVLKELKI